MPYLDLLFEKKGLPALGGPQCYEAHVVATSSQGCYVVLPSFDRFLRWGPCSPADATVAVGDDVSVSLSEDGRPWLVGASGGGGDGSGGGNIDGGEPDSVYGGTPIIDGDGVTP